MALDVSARLSPFVSGPARPVLLNELLGPARPMDGPFHSGKARARTAQQAETTEQVLCTPLVYNQGSAMPNVCIKVTYDVSQQWTDSRDRAQF